jgi:diguanylate cyclase (GGDEF)-like protein
VANSAETWNVAALTPATTPAERGAGHGRAWRCLRLAWVVLAVALVVYTATTLPGVRDTKGFDALIDGWGQNGVLVVASLLVALRVALVPSGRLAWASLSAGMGLYALGNILYFGWVQYDETLPYPSMADAAWLASYLFLFIGVMGLARRRVRAGQSRTVWLDAVVGSLGVCTAATVWLAYVLDHTEGSRAAVLTTMAYPVGDLVLLVVAVGTSSLMGWRPDRTWVLLGAGLALFAAADTLYVVRVAGDSYQAGTPLDALWAIALVLMAAGALTRPRPLPQAEQYGWSLLVMPSVLMLASLGLIVTGTFTRVPAASVALATATVLAGLGRATVTYRDVQRLAVSREQARTDELTGLGNRRCFYEAVENRVAQLGEDDHAAVLLLDLDRFKEVNDALGHSVGDRLLVEVGSRLSAHLRQDDVLARLGGDEFAIMLGSSTDTLASALAQRLLRSLEEPFVMDGTTVYIGGSIGVALCPDVATTVDGLLQRADIAMYEAKSERRGVVVYASRDSDLTMRLRQVEELRRAIDEDELVLHYQPKVDLGTGQVEGVEALVRWHHPEQGLLAPATFIPQAERYGFMRLLTSSVLATALEQVKQWRATGGPGHVAVNVSASSLLDTDLPRQIRTLLQERGLPGTALTVEITEDVLMVDPDRSLKVLHGLRELGVLISVDDYGTGFSSLARLRDLPVSELKLDRSFVAGILDDARAHAIVESTVQLAHSLGMRLVAEGIEDAASLDALRRMGCDVGQGYHLGAPADASAYDPPVVRRLPAPRTEADEAAVQRPA